MLEIERSTGPAGEILHLIAGAPPGLPPVARRDLEQAWEAAQIPVEAPPPRGFHFAVPDGPPVSLLVGDPDAASWAASVESCVGLDTSHGVSVCLRLLALVSLMAQSGWARGWFELRRDGAAIRPELLQAAALAPLSATGGFDETALRALMPKVTAQGLER